MLFGDSYYAINDFSFLQILGQACQALKEHKEAIKHYKAYLVDRGTNLTVLNAIGDCYFLLGENSEALAAWERSLEINPNQKELEEKVKKIKNISNKHKEI